MLRVFHRFREMDFEKLMAVYQEGNLENAQAFFPNDLPEVQLNKAQDAFAEYLREDFFRVKGAFYAVWEAENRYISALRMEPFEDGLLLEALETMPGYRRKGYAAKIICAVLKALPAGTTVYSHVHKRNTASLATHRHCGFQEALEYARYVDGTVSRYACTMKISVKP